MLNNTSFTQFFRESRGLLQLALPIMLTQLATQSMAFADTTMAGQVSAADLAAIALGTSLWVPVALLLRGIIMALTPVVAFHRGANEPERIRLAFIQMVWLAGAVSLVLIGYLFCGEAILNALAVAPEIIPIASDYVIALTLGVPGIALFYTLNGFCEGMNNTRAPMVVSIIGLLVNIPVNYMLIYGKFGLPALGAVGCGWATSLVYWLMSLLLFSYVKSHHHYKTVLNFTHIRPVANEMWQLFKLGLPIGLNIAICGSIFAVIALLIGRLGAENVAAAQIALNISSMSYMIPLSLSFGITIRVGHALGEQKLELAKQRSVVGVITAGLLSLISVSFFLLFPDWITALYTQDPAVAATAASLLALTAIYQFSDSLQTSANGALRGYKETKVPMMLAVASYWGLALPLGMVLGLTDIIVPAMGEKGFWVGIIVGLSTSAIAMLLRLAQTISRYMPKQLEYAQFD